MGLGSTPSCSQPGTSMASIDEFHPGNYCFYGTVLRDCMRRGESERERERERERGKHAQENEIKSEREKVHIIRVTLVEVVAVISRTSQSYLLDLISIFSIDLVTMVCEVCMKFAKCLMWLAKSMLQKRESRPKSQRNWGTAL